MSKQVKAWAAISSSKTEERTITRRAPDDEDVAINIKYAGICHSDISTVDGTWGEVKFPLVVGHEITGVVSAVGKNVTKFKVGDRVGVGCMVNSCRNCDDCKAGEEQYCAEGNVATYNAEDPKEGKKITQGGYSQYIVVDQAFVLSIPKNIPLKKAAPLLCAGITLFSPLNHWNAGPGKKVGIIGLGGLGHIGVKLAKAMGSHVTVFSRKDDKESIGFELGADAYIATDDKKDEKVFDDLKRSFDLIINTVSAPISTEPYLASLRRDGTLVEIGLPGQPLQVSASTLVKQRVNLSGSMIGSIAETQKMLDFCGEKDIYPEIEVIRVSYIDEAYTRVKTSDVKFRFVINIEATTEGPNTT